MQSAMTVKEPGGWGWSLSLVQCCAFCFKDTVFSATFYNFCWYLVNPALSLDTYCMLTLRMFSVHSGRQWRSLSVQPKLLCKCEDEYSLRREGGLLVFFTRDVIPVYSVMPRHQMIHSLTILLNLPHTFLDNHQGINIFSTASFLVWFALNWSRGTSEAVESPVQRLASITDKFVWLNEQSEIHLMDL